MAALDSRYDIIEQLANRLCDGQTMMATAESCTGGGIAQALTSVAGSSAWFDAGFVTYSNQAKSRMLGVAAEAIAEHGAVSKVVVGQMVSGAISNSEASYAVAVSGVAGPGGGSPDKPVGTVWIAWGSASDIEAECFLFDGDRDAVREQTIDTALQRLLTFLDEQP
ncbi:CinA family protein [Oceanospirillum linum]|uniref:Damage-inducible protein CinA n=1 Tax=Oceanospirillum linum TaxID=966 RepID=A0A1T1HAW9_OCELI|nr:CinA family protein [Oceanospirillum linum]OOV86999.1 damage-inducible protein CinA [Oceanospirillum linum]SEF71106.1 nicotinamide-nucleotide amidase [Oleiphilus messinensis]SMP15485.1 nicotinamide-nucleotide amidase [Oceanospirillum linum]